MRPRPAPACFVLAREIAARILQLAQEVGIAKRSLAETRDEE
jgi:hypothetical protein